MRCQTLPLRTACTKYARDIFAFRNLNVVISGLSLRPAKAEKSTNDLLVENAENLAMIVSDEEMEKMTGPVMARRGNATAERQSVNRTAFVQLPLR